jgi:hypothetical protein
MQSSHLIPETALDLREKRLDSGQARLWQQHVKECARCTRYLTEWEDLLTALKRSHLRSAPEQDRERAMAIFPPRSEERNLSIRRIFASIVFDSFNVPALAGARGTPVEARHLLLQAEDFDIHVQIRGEREPRQILGQILSRTREDFSIIAKFHLLRDGERLQASAAADPLGEFHFTDVPQGELSLQVDLPHLTIIAALKTN